MSRIRKNRSSYRKTGLATFLADFSKLPRWAKILLVIEIVVFQLILIFSLILLLI